LATVLILATAGRGGDFQPLAAVALALRQHDLRLEDPVSRAVSLIESLIASSDRG
jgi:hypothetical protein